VSLVLLRKHRCADKPGWPGAETVRVRAGKIALKRTQRTGPARPTRAPEPKPAWPAERHSGEGSASALETLQKLEKRRGAARPGDPAREDDPRS
jgi:hypothetical protein